MGLRNLNFDRDRLYLDRESDDGNGPKVCEVKKEELTDEEYEKQFLLSDTIRAGIRADMERSGVVDLEKITPASRYYFDVRNPLETKKKRKAFYQKIYIDGFVRPLVMDILSDRLDLFGTFDEADFLRIGEKSGILEREQLENVVVSLVLQNELRNLITGLYAEKIAVLDLAKRRK